MLKFGGVVSPIFGGNNKPLKLNPRWSILELPTSQGIWPRARGTQTGGRFGGGVRFQQKNPIHSKCFKRPSGGEMFQDIHHKIPDVQCQCGRCFFQQLNWTFAKGPKSIQRIPVKQPIRWKIRVSFSWLNWKHVNMDLNVSSNDLILVNFKWYTVNGSEIPRPTTVWMVKQKPLVNNGKKLPTSTSTGEFTEFLNHENSINEQQGNLLKNHLTWLHPAAF